VANVNYNESNFIPGGGSSGPPDWFEKFMQTFGKGGGLFGLGDTATGGLFSAGSSLLGGLAGLLGGESWGEKQAKKVSNLAQNRLGQDVLQPEQYMAEYKRAMLPEMNRSAEALNRRLGLDSGAAQSDLMFKMQAPLAQFMLNAKMQNDQLKSQNDNMLLQLMGGLSRG